MDSQAGCGDGQVTITNVPSLGGSQYRVEALNAAGQVAGHSYLAGNLEVHAFRFDATGLTDLGTLGGASSQAFALNSLGQVAGESTLTGDLATHAFSQAGGVPTDLGTLGGSYSSARAINDAGQVAGHSQEAGSFDLQAFLYSNGTMTGLGHLGGGASTAVALNQSGQVAGNSFTAGYESHAFLYSGGTMTDLGSLGGGYSAANALNDSGVVVGEASVANGETHAFLYSGGTMTDLSTLGGTYSSAYRINNAGQIIGISATTGDAQVNGFLFSGGTLTDLGTLGGSFSTPLAINNLGQVVGETETADYLPRAFLWANGSMSDLNTLIPTNSGWELTSARFINDAGRIVGTGMRNGEQQWFVLDLGGDNHPPVAAAGADQTLECSGLVALDGSQSSDPDSDVLTFEWSEGGTVLGTTATLTTTLTAGTHTITLKVSDPCGQSAQDDIVVNVVGDTTPPAISGPATLTVSGGNCQALLPDLRPLVVAADNCTPVNALTLTQSPVAGTQLGSGQYPVVVTATDAAGNSATCTTVVTVADTNPPVILRTPKHLTVPVHRDCQGQVPQLLRLVKARDNCTPRESLVITQLPAAGTKLEKGEHAVTITVTDLAGNSTSRQVTLKIADCTPPKIHEVTATPNVISPADGRSVAVTVRVNATDNCGTVASARIVRVLCDDRTAPGDIKITGALTVRLATANTHRNYKIIVVCQDDSGNKAYDCVTVKVAKARTGKGHDRD
jgi:probable HAF family extracellular repeat protein